MSPKSVRNLTLLLVLIVTTVIIRYRTAPTTLGAGIAFLIAAYILCIKCVIQTIEAQAIDVREKKLTAIKVEPSILHQRAKILLLVSWQIALVGILNIAATIESISMFSLLLEYASAVLYCVCTYEVISLADSSEQVGGYRPVNFFGYPRSRRLLFALFAGGSTIFPLTIISLEDTLSGGGWRPSALRAPQACLLMIAIMSAISAGLLYQRYRGEMTSGVKRVNILTVTLLFLACIAILQQTFSFDIYVYVLSAIAIIGSAMSLSYQKQGVAV